MDIPAPVSPSVPPPDLPPPYWRWETLASWGLSGTIILLVVLATNKPDLAQAMRAEMLVTLFVSLFIFGIGLGFSGARQGGRANRILALLAMAFHVLLVLALLGA